MDCVNSGKRRHGSGLAARRLSLGPTVDHDGPHGSCATRLINILKSDESCISDPKSETLNLTDCSSTFVGSSFGKNLWLPLRVQHAYDSKAQEAVLDGVNNPGRRTKLQVSLRRRLESNLRPRERSPEPGHKHSPPPA